MKNPSKEQLETWRTDNKYWKLGVFYYNPEDERLLPPKRIAWMGWTVNFANWKSTGLFILILILVFVLIYIAPDKN